MRNDTLNDLNRTKIAVFGIVALAVLSIFNLLLDIPVQKMPDIVQFDTYVARARPSLPREGVIGYYTDLTDTPGRSDAAREFYLALRKAGVPAEMHIYEHGPHGVGLAPLDEALSSWPARLADWLRGRGLLNASSKL